MKLINSILLCLLVISASAEIDPPNFRWGAYSPGWRGNGHGLTNVNPKPFSVSTNMTFNTGAGVAFAAIDEFAGVTLSDTNGNAKFLFDGFASTLSFLDKTATTRLDIDAANKLHINNPIITGTLTGSILNATNLPVSGLNTNGGTPGQVATAQANGTVTWSNAPAGSGTSVTFDSTQFGSASGGTNIKSGALFTNTVNRIADETIFVTDSSGAGNPLLSWDSDNGDIRVHANLVVRDGYYGHGGNLTNLSASQLTTGIVPAGRLADGVNLTNLVDIINSPTNSWTANTAFPLGHTNLVLTSGAGTNGITGLSNKTLSGARFGTLSVIATGNLWFTNPVAFITSDQVDSRLIGAGQTAEITVKELSGRYTNLLIVISQ